MSGVVILLIGSFCLMCVAGSFTFPCKALVLLIGVILFIDILLQWVYCVIYTMCVLACSFCVVVSSALLYIAIVCLILPCWKKFSGGAELGWVIILLSAGWGIGGGWMVGLILWLLEF